MKKFLALEFVPRSADLALLVLRVWLGVAMGWLHGWGKLLALFGGRNPFDQAILGLPPAVAFPLTTFAEVGCAALLIVGLWTRLAAFVLVVTMAVAFFVAHGAKLSGPGSGELAFVYLAGYFAVLLAGAGRFSVDGK